MALDISQGRDVALVRREATGRYDLDFFAGNPRLDDTRTRPGSRSAEGGYYFDPQNRRGTLLWTVSQDRMSTPSQLKAFAEDGMQQLVDAKLIASFTASARRVRPGQFRLDVTWTNPDGTRVPGLSLTP